MKTMSDYTIYCTAEQTRKAINLGALIERGHDDSRYFNIGVPVLYDENDEICRIRNSVIFIPTAEQMLGWLRKEGLHAQVMIYGHESYYYALYKVCSFEDAERIGDVFDTCEQATLAAIDAALDYLEKQKEK